MIHSTLRDRIGHFGARVDGNIKLSIFFDEIRLKRSLRPLSLFEAIEVIEATEVVEAVEVIEAAEVSNAMEIPQYVKERLFFLFLEAKEAVEPRDFIWSVEVIEATEMFRTT